jgi:hypothetical protein
MMRRTSAGGQSQTSTSEQSDENSISQETTYPQVDIPRPGSEVPQALARPTRESSSRFVLGTCQLATTTLAMLSMRLHWYFF